MILIEAPSSAYPCGRLSLGHHHAYEEETSGDSTPNSTHVTVASTGMLVPCPAASCIGMARAWDTGIGPLAQSPVSRRSPPTERIWSSGSQASSPGTGGPTSAPETACLLSLDMPSLGTPC